jgi:hypothetical protein
LICSGRRQADQLGAAGEEFGRTALISVDMRILSAEHGAVGRHQHREGERIGGGAGGNRKKDEVGFEDVARLRLQPQGPFVGAVGGGGAVIGGRDGLHDLGRDGRHVVATEIPVVPSASHSASSFKLNRARPYRHRSPPQNRASEPMTREAARGK